MAHIKDTDKDKEPLPWNTDDDFDQLEYIRYYPLPVPPRASSENPSVSKMDRDRFERGNSGLQDYVTEKVSKEENNQLPILESSELTRKTSKGAGEGLHIGGSNSDANKEKTHRFQISGKSELTRKTSKGAGEGLHIGGSNLDAKKEKTNRFQISGKSELTGEKSPSSSPPAQSGQSSPDYSSFLTFYQDHGEGCSFEDLIFEQQDREQRKDPFQISNASSSAGDARSSNSELLEAFEVAVPNSSFLPIPLKVAEKYFPSEATSSNALRTLIIRDPNALDREIYFMWFDKEEAFIIFGDQWYAFVEEFNLKHQDTICFVPLNEQLTFKTEIFRRSEERLPQFSMPLFLQENLIFEVTIARDNVEFPHRLNICRPSVTEVLTKHKQAGKGNRIINKIIKLTDTHNKIWFMRIQYFPTGSYVLVTDGWARFVEENQIVKGDIVRFFYPETSCHNRDFLIAFYRMRKHMNKRSLSLSRYPYFCYL